MRTFILIIAMVLASATAQADGSRSLTLAQSDPPAAAVEAPKATEATTNAPKVETSKYVARPPLVEPKSSSKPAQAVADNAASAPKAEKPRRQRYWTEQRIVGELHRHGIYW
jgi:hypothetical protein